MVVSIITVCYNSGSTLRQTIESVLNQTYANIEYIIIDGGSTDGTVDIIEEYAGKGIFFISEPDSGIYDAMNKGIKKASGDVIGILNSDDVYFNNNVINKVANEFKERKVDAVYGNLLMSKYDNINKYVRKWISGAKKSFIWGWHPPHPALFIKKSCYDTFGLYKPNYDVSADFELMLRFFEVNKISSFYLDEVLVIMRLGGESTGSFKNILLGNINIKRAFKENKMPYFWIYPFIRVFKKIFQFIRA
jgi:glycosyltransferase involved in cell wall biosynthesis